MSHYHFNRFGVSFGMERGLRTNDVKQILVSLFDSLIGYRRQSRQAGWFRFMDVVVLLHFSCLGRKILAQPGSSQVSPGAILLYANPADLSSATKNLSIHQIVSSISCLRIEHQILDPRALLDSILLLQYSYLRSRLSIVWTLGCRWSFLGQVLGWSWALARVTQHARLMFVLSWLAYVRNHAEQKFPWRPPRGQAMEGTLWRSL